MESLLQMVCWGTQVVTLAAWTALQGTTDLPEHWLFGGNMLVIVRPGAR